MAGNAFALTTVTSTTYTTDPQLDAGEMRGSVACAHMTPAGIPILVSLDGKTDAGKMDPATGVVGLEYSQPYYSKVWARLAAPGAADVQIVIEGA